MLLPQRVRLLLLESALGSQIRVRLAFRVDRGPSLTQNWWLYLRSLCGKLLLIYIRPCRVCLRDLRHFVQIAERQVEVTLRL